MIVLTKKEEDIMQVIWKLEKAFIRDIVNEMPAPKSHYNTVATIVKILVKKGALNSEMLGNTHQYTPLIAYDQYKNQSIKNIKQKFFDNSLTKMFTHFAQTEKMSEEEKKELIRIIKSKKL